LGRRVGTQLAALRNRYNPRWGIVSDGLTWWAVKRGYELSAATPAELDRQLQVRWAVTT
jgi:hypothetical protein